METPFSFDAKVDTDFDEAIKLVTAALKEQGFGVLTTINVHDTLKAKLGVDFRRYTILGACNPPLAHRALTTVPEVGLMLPCNVTVEVKEEGGCLVRIVDPMQMMAMGGMSEDLADGATYGSVRVVNPLRDESPA